MVYNGDNGGVVINDENSDPASSKGTDICTGLGGRGWGYFRSPLHLERAGELRKFQYEWGGGMGESSNTKKAFV